MPAACAAHSRTSLLSTTPQEWGGYRLPCQCLWESGGQVHLERPGPPAIRTWPLCSWEGLLSLLWVCFPRDLYKAGSPYSLQFSRVSGRGALLDSAYSYPDTHGVLSVGLVREQEQSQCQVGGQCPLWTSIIPDSTGHLTACTGQGSEFKTMR